MLTRLLVAALSSCLAAGAAAQSRYTVRDATFVDLGDEGYRLYGFFPAAATSSQAARWSALAEAIFFDTNVTHEVVDPADASSTWSRWAALRDATPGAVLVGPGGRALAVPVHRRGAGFDASAGLCLEAVVGSPLRAELRARAQRHLCVGVLALGARAAANQRAERAVRAAFAGIIALWADLPKPVGELPHLIVVPREQRDAERVLLWSLGLPERRHEPCLALVAGRSRRVGAALEGEAIATATVLSVVRGLVRGCEAPADPTLARGAAVPQRRTARSAPRAAAALGFDPTSSAVIAEVSALLERAERARVATQTPRAAPAVVATPAATAEAVWPPPEPRKPAFIKHLVPEPTQPTQPVPDAGLPAALRVLLLAVAGLIVLGIGAGAVLWLRLRAT